MVKKMNFKLVPKVELHLHLDGSVDIKTACDLMGKSVKEVKEEMVASDKCSNLNEYLTKFSLANDIMQTKENISRVTKELITKLKDDNVIYAEVRFCPLFHLKEGLTQEEVVETVISSLKDNNIKVNLILCMMRNLSFLENKKIIELAYKYLNKGVVALDLAGSESLYKTEDFEELFKIAQSYNIPFTIHAGEADGRESILKAISFNTKRLGHGIRCIEDMDIVKLIKDKDITLEVCPTSNIQTNIYQDYQSHPIKKLYDLGVLVTINTDNRTVSNITLTEEYQKLNKTFGFNVSDFKRMNINAIKAAFLSEIEKEKYIDIIKNYKECD